jgi:hypothetical protein
MATATTRLTCHAAYGVVPRCSIGIQFWISGEPAEVIVKVTEPKPIVAGMNRRGRPAWRNSASASGNTENATTNRLTPP